MGKVVVIRQNTEQANIIGMEKIGISMFPNTNVCFSIPYINGEFRHNLTSKELKVVEEHYGVKFNTERGKEFYSTMAMTIPTGVYTLDLDNAKDLLFYKVTLGTGAIAPDLETAKNPMCKSLFYFYDGEEEEKLVADENAKMTDAIIALADIRAKEPERLVILAKYLLKKNKFTVDTAFNALSNKIVKDSKSFVPAFNTALKSDKKVVKVSVQVVEAIDRGILKRNRAGQYVNPITTTEYGKNHEEIISFLLNPKNSDELGTGGDKDKPGSLENLLK